MKHISASKRGQLLKARQNYIDTYYDKKNAYDAQITEFNEKAEDYKTKMKEFVSAFLSAELAALPGTEISIDVSKATRDAIRYYIIIRHKSTKSDKPKYKYGEYSYDVDSGHLKGLNWKFVIYLKTEKAEDGSSNIVTSKNVNINADVLEADDYADLKATYDLFAKIDTIDWNTIISRIAEDAPKREDTVTAPDPGRYSTYEWDTAIDQYDFDRIIGKDIWIRVKINREESYDRYNSNNPGVDGDGWVMILSQTDKFYFFHWISSRYDEEEAPRYSKYKIEHALVETYRLKKVYFKPKHPVQYATTKDLTEVQKPDYLGDISVDDD